MVIIKTQNRWPSNIPKNSLQSYKTQIKILPFPGLAQSDSEQPGPGATLLGWPKSIYFLNKPIKSYMKLCCFTRNTCTYPSCSKKIFWFEPSPPLLSLASHLHETPFPSEFAKTGQYASGLSLRAVTHNTCYGWVCLIFPWCYGWNCLSLIEFNHKITSFLQVWRTRLQVTQNLTLSLWGSR